MRRCETVFDTAMGIAVKSRSKDERYDVETHFGFGENWADYAQHVNEDDIKKAEEGLLNLIPASELKGKTFLDIGCGSGLHSLAALRQGARTVTAIDIDPNSVMTTQGVLKHFWDRDNYRVFAYNILSDEKIPELQETFDTVYSWGVLHHTGAMWDAIERAAAFVKPGGKFVIALYKKTPLCGFWKAEKKFYTALPKPLRVPVDYLYAVAYLAAKALTGDNPARYVREYQQQRGMRFMTDVRDWLGGYPYESVGAQEAKDKIEALGFELEKSENTQAMKAAGLFGSGCAEYVFRKK